MRMTASWSGSTDPTAYKSVARKMCPNGELPSDSQQTDLQVPTRHRGMRKARLAVHHRSACSGVKALRNTSPLGGRPLLPFRSLDPFRPLREPDRRRRNEERLSRSEQRTGNKPKIRLDRKSPIQVRIRLPPAGSLPSPNTFALDHRELVIDGQGQLMFVRSTGLGASSSFTAVSVSRLAGIFSSILPPRAQASRRCETQPPLGRTQSRS